MYIPVIGTTQPSKLISLAKNGRDSSGFVPRILFAFPDHTLKGRWNRIQLSPSHAIYWETVVLKILDSTNGSDKKLPLLDETYNIMEAWQHDNASQVDDLGQGTLAEMHNKAERQCLRLALNLQLLLWACGESDNKAISPRAARGAIELVEYFKTQSEKVCEVIYDSNPLDRLPQKKRDFYKALPDEFVSQDGIQLAESIGISRSSYYRMLKKEGLFSQSKHNTYIKTA